MQRNRPRCGVVNQGVATSALSAISAVQGLLKNSSWAREHVHGSSAVVTKSEVGVVLVYRV